MTKRRNNLIAVGGLLLTALALSLWGGPLTLAAPLLQPPTNDNLANAVDVTTFPFETTVNVGGATLETDERKCDNDSSSVWYKVTPTSNGRLTVSAQGDGVDFVDSTIGIYTGAAHPLTEVGCDDSGGDNEVDQLTNVTVLQGKTYYVRVADAGQNPGPTKVTINFTAGFRLYLPLVLKPAMGWQPQTSNVTTKLNSVDCPTTTFCVAVGEGGQVLKTTNGGAAWSSQTSGVGNNLNDVDCIDANTCVAVGDGGAIIRSADGGTTWSSKGSGTGQNLRGIGCATTTCFAVGGTGTSTGVFSFNSGDSWSPSPVSLGNTDLYGADCPNNGTCTIVGLFGRVLVFAGTGVKAGPFNLGPNLRDVDCATESVCLTVGVGGAIQKTGDGGSSWAARTSGTSQSLGGISCNDQTCYAAGNGGTVITSANSGENWSVETTNVTTNLNGISCPTTTTCFAVGDGGLILNRK